MEYRTGLRNGYVKIQIRGGQTERFLNLCKGRNIAVYDLQRKESQCLTGCLSISDFFKLKPIHKKTKVQIHILEKHGLPFFFYRSKKRKAFFLGIMLGMMLVWNFTGRLWNIEIEGNIHNSTPEIMKFLNEEGIRHGMPCRKVQCSEIAAALRTQFADIAWVSAKLDGTHLVLNVKEGIFFEEEEEKASPCNIKADSMGEIVKMVTRAGMPRKGVGDLCQNGELLVSGILEVKNDDGETVRYETVHADADIYVRRKKAYYRAFSMKHEEDILSGAEKRGIYIKIGNLYAGVSDHSKDGWIREAEEKQLFLTKSFRLPVFFGNVLQKQYETTERKYTQEEAEKLAWDQLKSYEEKLMQKGVQISANNVKIEVDHETCISRGFLEIIEKIGEETPVEIPEQPAERTTDNG